MDSHFFQLCTMCLVILGQKYLFRQDLEREGIEWLFFLYGLMHFNLNSKYHKSCQQHSRDPNPKCIEALGPNISYPLRVLL